MSKTDQASTQNYLDLPSWKEEKDPSIRRRAQKTAEECNELSIACLRANLQGIDSVNPATGQVIRNWIQDECADVLAQIELCIKKFGLDENAILERKARKKSFMLNWEAKFNEQKPESS